jgi:uncharacterized protein (UPF0332 family)
MNKTKPQPVNATQVKQFLADARRRVVAAKRNLAIDAETGYQVAYEAMIKGSLALMLSHGQRPRKQLGHHMVIIDFAKDNLMRAPAETFDKRHRSARGCRHRRVVFAPLGRRYQNQIALTANLAERSCNRGCDPTEQQTRQATKKTGMSHPHRFLLHRDSSIIHFRGTQKQLLHRLWRITRVKHGAEDSIGVGSGA